MSQRPDPAIIESRSAVIALEDSMYDQYIDLMRELHEECEVLKDMNFSDERASVHFGNALMNVNFIGLACVDFETREILGILIGGIAQPPTSTDLIAQDIVFYVAKGWRQGFVAKSLLNAFEAWAKRKGAHRAFASDIKGLVGPAKALTGSGWKNFCSTITKVIG